MVTVFDNTTAVDYWYFGIAGSNKDFVDCNGDFVCCQTMNDRIRLKTFAVKAEIQLKPGEQDQGVREWLYVSSPDDLFQHNIRIDFAKLNCQPLLFNLETDKNLVVVNEAKVLH